MAVYYTAPNTKQTLSNYFHYSSENYKNRLLEWIYENEHEVEWVIEVPARDQHYIYA